jgi:hypothetical protein
MKPLPVPNEDKEKAAEPSPETKILEILKGG